MTGDAADRLADVVVAALDPIATIASDPVRCRHQCGPLTLAALRALRAAGYDCGAWFVTGWPPSSGDGVGDDVDEEVGSAHYVCVVRAGGDAWVLDVAYRQFCPDSPWPLIYPAIDYACYGWDSIDGDLFVDEPEDTFRWTYPLFDDAAISINEFLWNVIGSPTDTTPGL